jgi:hypothetical protein
MSDKKMSDKKKGSASPRRGTRGSKLPTFDLNVPMPETKPPKKSKSSSSKSSNQ